VAKEIYINSSPQETRIALVENKRVAELFFERTEDKGIVGNIYKGRVVRVLPGMQAAFVDIGHERAAFLYAGDFVKTKHNVEDIEEDEGPQEIAQARRRRRGTDDVPPIAELVREGQEIMVQVAKGPIGTKGARLTCHVSLPGRYLVFMPGLRHSGVSRKIENFDLRKKLKKIIDSFKTREGGFIVRTAASTGITERQIRADVEYLINLWKKIERKFNSHGAPQLLHYDLDLTTRLIRDYLEDDIDRLVIDSQHEHRKVLRFIRNFNPELRDKIELHSEPTPLFDKFSIEQEINKALGKRVWLKSGGYLIIESTEALTSIDVNTGRFVGKKTLEETILKTNLEAAEEIVKQLRLRNIGGIIIIDFIDMEKDSSKDQVYRFLESLLRDDKNRTTVLKISSLGLVEMTRKRSRDPLIRYMTETCPTCDGKGFVKSKMTVAHQVLRDIKRELPHHEEDHLFVTVHPDVYAILKNQESETIVMLEKQFQKGVKLAADPSFHPEQIGLSIPKNKAKAQPQPLNLEKRSTPEQTEEDEDDWEAYQSDVKAIQNVKDQKARQAAEAKERERERERERAEAQRLEAEARTRINEAAAADSASRDPQDADEPDMDIPETPVIRDRQEALSDDDDEDEVDQPSVTDEKKSTGDA
jgi:ribonuclease G